LRALGPFDVIVALSTANSVIGGSFGPPGYFSDILAPQGVFIGSYLDHDSVLANREHVEHHVGRRIQIAPAVSDSFDYALGTRVVTTGSATVDSPVLTPVRVDAFSEHNRLACQMYRGGSIFSTFEHLTNEIPLDTPLRNTPIPSLVTICMFREILDSASTSAVCVGESRDHMPYPGGRLSIERAIQRFFGVGVESRTSSDYRVLTIDARGLRKGDEILFADAPQFGRPVYLQCVSNLTGYDVLFPLNATFHLPNLTFNFKHRYVLDLINSLEAVGCRCLSYREYTWFQWAGRNQMELISLFDGRQREADAHLPLIAMTRGHTVRVPVVSAIVSYNASSSLSSPGGAIVPSRYVTQFTNPAPVGNVSPSFRPPPAGSNPPAANLVLSADGPQCRPLPVSWDKGLQVATLRVMHCSVCLENERNVVLMPCRHLCCCSVCSRQLALCPVCKAVISEFFPIYNV